jgi:hypothetical protein
MTEAGIDKTLAKALEGRFESLDHRSRTRRGRAPMSSGMSSFASYGPTYEA